MFLSKEKCNAKVRQRRFGIFRRAIEIKAKGFKRIGTSRLARRSAIAMLCDGHTACRNDDCHCRRHVQAVAHIATGAAYIDGVGGCFDNDGCRVAL